MTAQVHHLPNVPDASFAAATLLPYHMVQYPHGTPVQDSRGSMEAWKRVAGAVAGFSAHPPLVPVKSRRLFVFCPLPTPPPPA